MIVYKCYDPPTSGTTAGGFFMDGTGDYQSLPMVTSAINHTSHHPQYPYHHQHYHQQQHQQQQQQHHYQYTPYPNGPPPSYDTVVAQDELLASASHHKRTYPPLLDETQAGSSSHSCSDHELHDCDKQSSVVCNGATPLLPKTLHGRRSPRNCDVSASNVRTYSDDPADEPDWSDEEHRPSCNCPTLTSGSISGPVPPIYCRNCGYFVERRSSGYLSSTAPTWQQLSTSHRHHHRPNPNELTRNETLLVDYETTANDYDNDVNRNNVIDDEGTTVHILTTTPVDIDTRTTMQMIASAPSSPTGRFDTMNNNNNNNNTSASNETKSGNSLVASNLSTMPQSLAGAVATAAVEEQHQQQSQTAPLTGTSSATAENSENNNIIIDCSSVNHRDASTDGIIHQCPNTSNQCCNQLDSYLQDLEGSAGGEASVSQDGDTNGNTDSAAPREAGTGTGAEERLLPTGPSPGIRSLLNDNGLVRLDMSQIIDNTGLPTYEAALKLESSGYV
uniref:Uncharacterized protein n=1 Tax=Anopheles christyi TaxID=43041 RepID=A0A182JQ09_9DIPT